MSRDEFWSLSPREIKQAFECTSRRLVREHNERAWQAYHTAVISREKRPRLKKYLTRIAPRRQSHEEQIAVWRMWEAMHKVGLKKDIANG